MQFSAKQFKIQHKASSMKMCSSFLKTTTHIFFCLKVHLGLLRDFMQHMKSSQG